MRLPFVWILSYLVLFIFVLLHTSILDRPLIGLHDMDNGHLLTTAYLWRSEGIVKHSFAPIYSFTPGDINLRNWGLVATNNRMYHASYPPLSFWLIYLTTLIPGIGVTVVAAHFASLIVFTLALVFLFVYLRLQYNTATALFACGLFSLVPPSLYFFGGVFVADIAVLGFWVSSFVWLSWYREQGKPYLLLGFLLFFGLACLTEWLAVLTAVILIVYFSLSFFIFRQKKDKEKSQRSLFLVFGITAVLILAMAITARVYLSVSSLSSLTQFLINKYLTRSNIVSFTTILSGDSYLSAGTKLLVEWLQRIFVGYFWFEYTPFFWLLVGIGIVILLGQRLIKNPPSSWLRIQKKASHDNGLIFVYFFLPPILHTLLLSEFHFVHDYAALSLLPGLVIITAKGFYLASCWLEKKLFYSWQSWQAGSFALAAGLIFTMCLAGAPIYHFFFISQTGGWRSTIRLMEATRAATQPEDLILTNYSYNPDLWFYLRRNAIQWVKTDADREVNVGTLALYRHAYYVSDYRPFVDAVCGRRKLYPVAQGYLCSLK